MFIQTQTTPNPDTLKFLPGQDVCVRTTLDFSDAKSAQSSPLARMLFKVDGVQGVYLGSDFISITKSGDYEWLAIKPLVLGVIMDHFVSGRPIIEDSAHENDNGDEGDDGAGGEIIAQIKDLIEMRVRPSVAKDGGDITFMRFQDGVVWLKMKGACAGCPSSTATLKSGIENMLRHYVPEVQEVRAG